jgi:hypothetical protein
VMERLGITEAIAFDRHFREYGRFISWSRDTASEFFGNSLQP